MIFNVKKKLICLLQKDDKIVVKNDERVTPDCKLVPQESSISTVKRYMYQRFEKVKIDKNFKYYHYALSGNVKTDFDNLFGEHDTHGSARVLDHSFRDNYLKIQRSHDIGLSFDKGVYNIYNGRHRLIYLKHFYDMYHCEGIDLGYEAPAHVNYYVDDNEINEIIASLVDNYRAIIYKGNYYDDTMSFCITVNNKIYVVKSKEELKEFYESFKDSCQDTKYFVGDVSSSNEVLKEEVFNYIFEKVGKDLFEMSFIDLIYYLRDNRVFLNDKIIEIKDLNIGDLYAYYLNICQSIQVCKVYGYDIPDGLEVIKVRSEPINIYGAIIMDFLYENPVYQDLTWPELYEIVKNFVRFNGCNSEFLKMSALRFGYIEGCKKFQKNKKNRFSNKH